MNAAEPPSSYNTKKEETKEMKILFKKREIELEEAIKKRTI